jgi:calcium/calmodulin-dependent protein kinase I
VLSLSGSSGLLSRMASNKPGKYQLGAKLGAGKFSDVYLATLTSDPSKRFAVKVIDVSRLSSKDRSLLDGERKVLEQLKHPNIVQHYESYEAGGKVHLVTEYLEGGELFDSIIDREKYTEADARRVLTSIAEALKYCHSKGIVHRDLKPENILLCKRTKDSDVKLADFGFARMVDLNGGCETQLGTPGYVAPEILKKQVYQAPVDMWAFGVIAYILLCGYPPFYGNNDHELFVQIKGGTFSFDPAHWSHISEKAKDMIRQLLKLDPHKRLTAEGVLSHPWMTGEASTNADLTPAIGELRSTLMKRKLKGGVEAVLAVNKLKNRKKAADSGSSSPVKSKLHSPRKPKPVHPLDLDLFRVALLPLVSSVILTVGLFLFSSPGKTHDGSATPFDVAYGLAILLYLCILHSSRCLTLGWHYLGEILWGCNIALLLSGVGIATNRPMMVGTAVCVVAVDQLCWYIDVLGYVATRKFPVGVAKYMTAPTTTWVHAITGTHHLWFIPVALLWLASHGGIPPGSYWGSVATTSVIATLARMFTPFAVRQGLNAQDVRVWNINLAYEFYDDVAIPPLHVMDHKPPHLYLPFLILVCNFILNVLPCALVIALSRIPFGGEIFALGDWFPNFNLAVVSHMIASLR